MYNVNKVDVVCVGWIGVGFCRRFLLANFARRGAAEQLELEHCRVEQVISDINFEDQLVVASKQGEGRTVCVHCQENDVGVVSLQQVDPVEDGTG